MELLLIADFLLSARKVKNKIKKGGGGGGGGSLLVSRMLNAFIITGQRNAPARIPHFLMWLIHIRKWLIYPHSLDWVCFTLGLFE